MDDGDLVPATAVLIDGGGDEDISRHGVERRWDMF